VWSCRHRLLCPYLAQELSAGELQVGVIPVGASSGLQTSPFTSADWRRSPCTGTLGGGNTGGGTTGGGNTGGGLLGTASDYVGGSPSNLPEEFHRICLRGNFCAGLPSPLG